VADAAFDADRVLVELDERGATAVILPKSNRLIQRIYDRATYAWRRLFESYFAKFEDYRAIARQYDKTDASYAANWNLIAAIVASR